jgi:hypothetical protein
MTNRQADELLSQLKALNKTLERIAEALERSEPPTLTFQTNGITPAGVAQIRQELMALTERDLRSML